MPEPLSELIEVVCGEIVLTTPAILRTALSTIKFEVARVLVPAIDRVPAEIMVGPV